MLKKNALSAFLLLAALAGLGKAADPKLQTLPQNWSDAERHKFWFIDQGSKIMPMAWFRNLQRSNSDQLFAASENLLRYGFVKDESNIEVTPNLNKYKLPIGFSVGSYNLVEFVGLTCAACHTGNVRLGDRSILIEGAPSMLNFDLFLDELVKAMVKTRDDPAQRSRFIARFDSGPPPDMKYDR